MWHYCEYVPTLRVKGGQLYHCWHCSAEQFVADPEAAPAPVEQPKSEYSDEIPF